MRLIDADALIKSYLDHCRTEFEIKNCCMASENVLAIIQNAPTVEPQKIVTIPPELIEKLASCVVNIVGNIDWEKAIEAYKARPQGEWVLITERLPDRFEDVLITYQIPNREPKVRRALYVGGKFNFDNGDTWNWNDPEVKAWMPLPEAYKETEND